MLITTISSLFCSIPLLLICTGESGIFSVHVYAMEDMKDSSLQGVLFLSIKCFSVVVVACCSPSLLVSFVSSKHHLLKSAICLLLFLPWLLTFLFHVFFSTLFRLSPLQIPFDLFIDQENIFLCLIYVCVCLILIFLFLYFMFNAFSTITFIFSTCHFYSIVNVKGKTCLTLMAFRTT